MVKLSVKGLSAKQIQRLRNSHGVRVSDGDGFSLDVDEGTFNKVKKAFMKGKGITLKLNGDEIERNRGMEGNGLFKGLKKAFKKVGKNKIVKGMGKDVASAVKQVKKGFSSTEGAKNLALDIAVGAIPYAGNNTKSAIKGETKQSMKGKGLQSFMRKTGRSLGKVGRNLSKIAKKAPVAAVLNQVSQGALEFGTDALIGVASTAAPAAAPLITVGLKAAQAKAAEEINDSFKKKTEQSNRGSVLSRGKRVAISAANSVYPELEKIATDKLKKELESRLGMSIDDLIASTSMMGTGIRLSSQEGQGIMLGNGIDNLMGVNGSVQGFHQSRRSHYQHYPAQKYNI